MEEFKGQSTISHHSDSGEGENRTTMH